MFKKTLLHIAVLMTLVAGHAAQSPRPRTDTVIVMPFQNLTPDGEHDWIGESFADALPELLTEALFATVSSEERRAVQREDGARGQAVPSLASAIRLAERSGASMVLLGSYSVESSAGGSADVLKVKVTAVRVAEGPFSESAPEAGGRIREIEVTEAVSNLQPLHGQIAYWLAGQTFGVQTAVERDKLVRLAMSAPQKAYEAYMRGVTAPEGNPRVREGFLKVALEIFARENKGDTYEKAALELGHLQIGQGRFQDALGNFSKIGARSPHRVESLFYSALCLWVERKFEQAALSLKEIPEARRVAAVYNTLGALAIEEHRSPRDAQSRPVVEIGEGMRFLDAALRLTPDDPDIWFNRGLGAMISGDAKTAAANLRKFTEVRPREGDGFFLLAKVLESEGSPDAARFDEQARRLLTKDNRYAKLQVQWKEAGRLDGIFLRIRPIPRNAFLRSLKAHQRPIPAGQGTDRVDEILEDARRLYLADDRESDEKAVELLRRGIYIDRMRAELYHYLGLIALRGKDLAEAEKQFRQSTFWQPDYPEAFTAYAALVRIYIQRKNCLDAQNYFRLAAKADPAREEDLAGLKGMLDRCQN